MTPPQPEPKWLIPQDSMIMIMTDIHIVEGSRMGGKTIGDTLPTKVFFEALWKKYNISRPIYDSNFNYYVRNAQRMDEVYEKVLERLSKMEAQLKEDTATSSAEPRLPSNLDSSVKALETAGQAGKSFR